MNDKKSPTGRMYQAEPNIQNIPVRTPEGAAIKAAFVKRAGIDFPCALHIGPAGCCDEHNCRCF